MLVESEDCFSLPFQTAQFAVLWALFVLIVLGNLSVLLALAFNKHRKSRMNFFIMQLAIAGESTNYRH